MAPVVMAIQAMRDVSFVTAVPVVAEIGDMRRFNTPRELMSYLGLVPSEYSRGGRTARGGITKASSKNTRRVLIDGAWTDRHKATVGPDNFARLDDLPKAVRDMAWKAQVRLCARYRRLAARQSANGGDHRDRPRDGGIYLGHRATCAASCAQLAPERSRQTENSGRKYSHKNQCALPGAGLARDHQREKNLKNEHDGDHRHQPLCPARVWV